MADRRGWFEILLMQVVFGEQFVELAGGDSSSERRTVQAPLMQGEQFLEVLSLDVVKGLLAHHRERQGGIQHHLGGATGIGHDFLRKAFRTQDRGGFQNVSPLQQVFQLPDVAGPRVAADSVQGFHAKPVDFLFPGPVGRVEEVVGEDRLMFAVDYPYANCNQQVQQAAGIELANPDKFYHLNAKKVFRLD